MIERIKQIRQGLGLTLAVFAQEMKIPYRTAYSWESVGSLSRKSISLICRTFGVNPEWLRTGAGAVFSDTPLKEHAGDQLAKARGKVAMTQVKLAAASQVSPATVVQWENGDSEIPQSKLKKICQLLKVDEDWLTGAANDAEEEKEEADDRSQTSKTFSVVLQILERLGDPEKASIMRALGLAASALSTKSADNSTLAVTISNSGHGNVVVTHTVGDVRQCNEDKRWIDGETNRKGRV